MQSTEYSTILPRAGFSWLMVPGTTLRGGSGLYAYNLSLDTYGGGMGGLLSASGNYSDPTNGITPAVVLGGTGTQVANGQPLIYQWNLDMQRAIGSNTSFELAYVASHGFN